METIVHMENGKYLGQTRLAPSLLRESLALAVSEVQGVAGLGRKPGKPLTDGIQITRAKDSPDLVVNVYLTVLNGYAVPDVAYRVQEAVLNMANQLTSNKIDNVHIYVKGAKYGASGQPK